MGCEEYEHRSRNVDAKVIRVLLHEVAQAVMVPTTFVLRSLVRDVGKELPRDGPVLSMSFKGGLTLSTSGNLPSMHVPGIPSGTIIVPTCSPQKSRKYRGSRAHGLPR